MARKSWFAILCLALCMAACQPAEEPSESVSTEADVEAIREVVRQYDVALRAANLDDYIALYANDAVQMPPGEATVIGKQAIRSRIEQLFQDEIGEIPYVEEAIQVSGDWAYQRLSYTESWTPKDGGETRSFTGKWLLIYQRQADGSWKISTEIWNADARSD